MYLRASPGMGGPSFFQASDPQNAVFLCSPVKTAKLGSPRRRHTVMGFEGMDAYHYKLVAQKVSSIPPECPWNTASGSPAVRHKKLSSLKNKEGLLEGFYYL